MNEPTSPSEEPTTTTEVVTEQPTPSPVNHDVTVDVPSPKEKPADCNNISSLPKDEYNRILRETFAYFRHKKVKHKLHGVGHVVGVSPRERPNGPDGNYLVVSVQRPSPKPGQVPSINVSVLPSELELV